MGVSPRQKTRAEWIWPLVTRMGIEFTHARSSACRRTVSPHRPLVRNLRGEMAYVARVRPRADGGPSLCDSIV